MSLTIDWNNSYCLGNNRALRVSIDCSIHPPPLLELKLTRYRVRETIACRDISASRRYKRIAEFLAVLCVQFTVAMLAQIDGQARRAK
jgi:hypothetical protein